MPSTKKYRDIEIIDALRKRYSFIIKYIYDNYFNKIESFVTRNNGTIDDAHEVFQDSLVYILEKIDEIDPPKFDFGIYLFNHASYLWLQIMEKRNQNNKQELRNSEKGDEIKNEEVTDIIQEYLNELDPKIQQALFLHFSGSSYEEIAMKMGWKDAKVTKKRIYCAKNKLIKGIKESEEYKNLLQIEARRLLNKV